LSGKPEKKIVRQLPGRIDSVPLVPQRFTQHDFAERIRALSDQRLINLFQFAQAYVKDTMLELQSLQTPPSPVAPELPIQRSSPDGPKEQP
jgi:hypothetical protein